METGVTGETRNTPEGVEIRIFGPPESLKAFLRGLRKKAPAVARLRTITVRPLQETPPPAFRVLSSREGQPSTYVPPDLATCETCQREIFTPSDRRYLYPFTNCTNCGPRYTVIQALPYDRERTSMRVFPMCPECLREYQDPQSRRFHAEPNACPVCGPRIWLCDRSGEKISVQDPWDFLVRTLKEGAIWAIKGVGGFHLVCDAENEKAVRKLRERKRRPTKPFAVMVRDLETAHKLAEISPPEAEALLSREAPIVLLKKKRPFPLAESVAPGIALVGIMLPYSPLHHILLRVWPGLALIMTSGNLSDEPLCYRNEEALERLSGLADYFLLHDREIVAPVDDSVVRFAGETRILIRRARGFAPEPLPLPQVSPALLGVGPLLKNTFCLTREKEAFPSPHLGDLEELKTLKRWEKTLEHYQKLLGTTPRKIVADLHPDYLSTRLAEEISQHKGLTLWRLQHHAAHAYAASGPCPSPSALALVLDGAGLGEDGSIWGGEILRLEGPSWQRLGHLEPVILPGGEKAEREPWRMALAYLHKLSWPGLPEVFRRIPEEELRMIQLLMNRTHRYPLTTSGGRLFEAAGFLLGLGERNRYEGEVALRLESLALEGPETPERYYEMPTEIQEGKLVLCGRHLLASLLQDLAQGVPLEEIAVRFHYSLARGLAQAASFLAEQTGKRKVLLSGGCFQNALFLKALIQELTLLGLQPLTNPQIPPNDGGISYGQVVWGALISSSPASS